MSDVLVLPREDAQATQWARRLNLDLRISTEWEIQGERCLFAASARVIPWHMVGAGFRFLSVWDAATPLWRYNVLAADVGGPSERARTEQVIRDLRVPLYAPEVLFVAQNETGRELVQVWRGECEHGSDERLAFLRALHTVKPRLCALPCSWLIDGGQSPAEPRATEPQRRMVSWPRPTPARRGPPPGAPQRLVNVEILPGRYVRCKPGEEAAVKARFERMLAGRDGSKAIVTPGKHKKRAPQDSANKASVPEKGSTEGDKR